MGVLLFLECLAWAHSNRWKFLVGPSSGKDMPSAKGVHCAVKSNKLIKVLLPTIKDRRVILLIHKYLDVRVIDRGMFEKTEVGMPQGEPLSPLLSNIMLNELDTFAIAFIGIKGCADLECIQKL